MPFFFSVFQNIVSLIRTDRNERRGKNNLQLQIEFFLLQTHCNVQNCQAIYNPLFSKSFSILIEMKTIGAVKICICEKQYERAKI